MNIIPVTEILFLGLTLGFVGKVLLGLTVINVHSHIVRERRLDKDVFLQMQRERTLGIIGIVFIFFGYALELIHFGYLELFFLT